MQGLLELVVLDLYLTLSDDFRVWFTDNDVVGD